MCGCEFNVAGAGGTIAGAVHGHFFSRSDISAIYHSAVGFDGEDEHDGVVLMHRREDYCIFSTKNIWIFNDMWCVLIRNNMPFCILVTSSL